MAALAGPIGAIENRFQPVAFCVVGTVSVACPKCRHINRYRFQPQTWKFQCKNAACRIRMTIGIRIMVINGSDVGCKGLVPPPEFVIPETWRSGEPAVIVETSE